MRVTRIALVVLGALAATAPGGRASSTALAQGSTAIVVPASIRVGLAHGSSYDISALPLDTYVARVLAGEAAGGSPPAALEALAITVRTFALANMGRHRADGFDVCDQTHCQVLRPSTPETERAAQATSGQVLAFRGALASVFYSASCGGYTERPSSVWPGADDPPYLPSRRDDACEGEPAWTDTLSRADLARALSAAGFQGALRDIRIDSRDESGRVMRVALSGVTPAEISGQDLRTAVARTFGAQHVKSAAFDVHRAGESYLFSGHGYGHGVGLCVMGSVKLAASGETPARILARYFPGTEIVASSAAPLQTAAPSFAPAQAGRAAPAVSAAVVVNLPDAESAEQAGIVALVTRARDDLAKSLAVSAPPKVVLRFHADADEYERATAEPWFTSAAYVNREIHLIPLASLRARGILERTIRRELVHVMVDTALGDRPAWVREGAALYFSDASRDAEAMQSRGPCPGDGELLQPLSAGALADAYARARSCFTRQISGGRAWYDVH